jgi:hypothetical protein
MNNRISRSPDDFLDKGLDLMICKLAGKKRYRACEKVPGLTCTQKKITVRSTVTPHTRNTSQPRRGAAAEDMRPHIPGQMAWVVEEKVTRKWRGDPLVRGFLTPRDEKVKKNRFCKLRAEAREQSPLCSLEWNGKSARR